MMMVSLLSEKLEKSKEPVVPEEDIEVVVNSEVTEESSEVEVSTEDQEEKEVAQDLQEIMKKVKHLTKLQARHQKSE